MKGRERFGRKIEKGREERKIEKGREERKIEKALPIYNLHITSNHVTLHITLPLEIYTPPHPCIIIPPSLVLIENLIFTLPEMCYSEVCTLHSRYKICTAE